MIGTDEADLFDVFDIHVVIANGGSGRIQVHVWFPRSAQDEWSSRTAVEDYGGGGGVVGGTGGDILRVSLSADMVEVGVRVCCRGGGR